MYPRSLTETSSALWQVSKATAQATCDMYSKTRKYAELLYLKACLSHPPPASLSFPPLGQPSVRPLPLGLPLLCGRLVVARAAPDAACCCVCLGLPTSCCWTCLAHVVVAGTSYGLAPLAACCCRGPPPTHTTASCCIWEWSWLQHLHL